jgi:NADH:ubiquinone oxidoreductase subunit 4 (subunit M)
VVTIPLVGSLFYVCIVFAFVVKMWLRCLWFICDFLRLKFSQSLVSSSIIFAGVLLKLDGYGLRVFPLLFKFGFKFSVV